MLINSNNINKYNTRYYDQVFSSKINFKGIVNKDSKISKPIKTISIMSFIGILMYLFLKNNKFINLSSESKNIKNFHLVDTLSNKSSLYRGAQLNNQEDCDFLISKNVGLVIDLRNKKNSKDLINKEKNLLNKNNIEHYNIEMSSKIAPREDQIEEVFNKIEECKKNNKSVYIHCKAGIDRTGIMCALYEVRKKNIPKSQAYEHMKNYGYNYYHQVTRKAQKDFLFQNG